mmetsp:Transcript_61775/g.157022  ORF Transcript_61775/g.157022 Transcript_61775/m.157022 type:complete len:231 (-) Transcript_61775:65-757(-)
MATSRSRWRSAARLRPLASRRRRREAPRKARSARRRPARPPWPPTRPSSTPSRPCASSPTRTRARLACCLRRPRMWHLSSRMPSSGPCCGAWRWRSMHWRPRPRMWTPSGSPRPGVPRALSISQSSAVMSCQRAWPARRRIPSGGARCWRRLHRTSWPCACRPGAASRYSPRLDPWMRSASGARGLRTAWRASPRPSTAPRACPWPRAWCRTWPRPRRCRSTPRRSSWSS